ncbi:MAG: NAD(+)/NADH kinase [Anaerolineae bacterium]|nr:NAD(+)/NADH kinase [Anaerolineae bacterium]
MKNPQIKNVGLVYNSQVEAALPLVKDISTWLNHRNIQTWTCAIDELDVIPQNTDLILTLGGDGSILRITQKTALAGTPLLGINLGRVGFLTETQPDTWEMTLERVVAGDAHVEERMMLCVSLIRDRIQIAQETALNDAVVSRSALARTVRLTAYIDGALLTRYVTDALILATATGSTAYAYALGGPILPPWLDNILVIPAAPHLSLERPLVLDAAAIVEVKINTEIPGMLSVDGRMEGELLNDDVVRIQRSTTKARFLRLRNRNDYYRTLVTRLTPRNGD